MDDLLYTLFIVAWIAYGIYKGVKKNDKAKNKTIPAQERHVKTQNESKVGKAFESIFDEVFDLSSSENDKISHPYTNEKVEKEPEKAPIYENYAGKEVLDSYKGTDHISSVFEDDSEGLDERKKSNKIFDTQAEVDDDNEKNTVFDLRQAVIHQIILQRPY